MQSALRISLEQWRALVAVVEQGSYAKAAEALHKTQSSVTYAVQKLQSSLGVEAFVPAGRKSTLTETGKLLYSRARLLLDDAAGIEKTARTVSAGWEPEIRIAVEVLFPNSVLLRCFDRFGLESPHTRIELIESVLAGTTEALLEHRVDLAISGQIPQDFASVPLLHMRMIAVANPAHPLHHLGRPITRRDLRTQRQLVVRESDSKRATKVSLDASQRWTVSNMTTSIYAAILGLGFAWFPDEKIRDELASGKLKALPLREGSERFAQLYLVYADRDNAGPGVRRLAEVIQEGVSVECARAGAVRAAGLSSGTAVTAPPRTRRHK
ncbi:MAG: LysR family transcriptional regulator [Casimicrobiaceae bacterium]